MVSVIIKFGSNSKKKNASLVQFVRFVPLVPYELFEDRNSKSFKSVKFPMLEIWLTDGTFKIRLFDSGKCPREVFRFSALNNKKKKIFQESSL